MATCSICLFASTSEQNLEWLTSLLNLLFYESSKLMQHVFDENVDKSLKRVKSKLKSRRATRALMSNKRSSIRIDANVDRARCKQVLKCRAVNESRANSRATTVSRIRRTKSTCRRRVSLRAACGAVRCRTNVSVAAAKNAVKTNFATMRVTEAATHRRCTRQEFLATLRADNAGECESDRSHTSAASVE